MPSNAKHLLFAAALKQVAAGDASPCQHDRDSMFDLFDSMYYSGSDKMPDKEVTVASFATETEALMWAETLQNEGIPSVPVPLGPGAGGFGSSMFRPFALRVRASDAERAKRILETLESGPSK